MARRTRRTAGGAEGCGTTPTLEPGTRFGDVTLDAGDALGGKFVQEVKLAKDVDGLVLKGAPLSVVLLVGQLAEGVVEFEFFYRSVQLFFALVQRQSKLTPPSPGGRNGGCFKKRGGNEPQDRQPQGNAGGDNRGIHAQPIPCPYGQVLPEAGIRNRNDHHPGEEILQLGLHSS